MIALLRCIKMNYVILLHKCSNDSQCAIKIFNFGQVFERWPPHLIRGNFLVPHSLAFRLNTHIYRPLNVRSFKYRTENVDKVKREKICFFFLGRCYYRLREIYPHWVLFCRLIFRIE